MQLGYQVIGWQEITPGTPPTAGNFLTGMNFDGRGVSDASGTLTRVDLLTGASGTGTGNMSEGFATGTAGSTLNFSTSIDLSGYGAGLSDISDYDYVGIRFHINGGDADSVGSTLDNVVLQTIPEPSSLLLTSIAFGFLAVRRKR